MYMSKIKMNQRHKKESKKKRLNNSKYLLYYVLTLTFYIFEPTRHWDILTYFKKSYLNSRKIWFIIWLVIAIIYLNYSQYNHRKWNGGYTNFDILMTLDNKQNVPKQLKFQRNYWIFIRNYRYLLDLPTVLWQTA